MWLSTPWHRIARLVLWGLLVWTCGSLHRARGFEVVAAKASGGDGGGDEVTVATYNVRTASQWAVRDGGDEYHGRMRPARRSAVAKTIRISGAAVVGTQVPVESPGDLTIVLCARSLRRLIYSSCVSNNTPHCAIFILFCLGMIGVAIFQEGLAWQLDDLLTLLGPAWQRVGVGRYNGTRDAGGDEDELAAILCVSLPVVLFSGPAYLFFYVYGLALLRARALAC